ncbi:MAG: tetratricopeptide repeat protein [Gemmatimonadales bacterium]
MATSEIEKLERRYADNPHGLTFAPLAEVHRKNGDVARALELLTAGLELHPNYIPASIVLGRCHQDLGDLPAAEAAFAHVLRLDDENVIALKSLADINERLEHFGEAENWLRRLVSVDRSNDEAREQLRRLEGRKKDAEVKPEKAEVKPEPAVASAPTLEVIDLEPEPDPATATAEPEQSPADVLPVDIAALELTPPSSENARTKVEVAESPAPAEDVAAVTSETQAPAASAPELEEPVSAGDAVQPVAGLISAEFEPPLQAIGGLGVETSEDLVLDASGNTEFRVPDASEDFKALAERMSAPRELRPAQRPEPAPRVAEDASTPLAEPKPAAESPPMEVQPVGMPVTRRSYLARETKGRSVASFFHSLLAARPPSEEARNNDAGTRSEADASAPAHGGQDMGPSGSADDDNPLAPPAPPAADQKGEGAVSFDDFFAAEREGSTPLRQRADPGKDDLDQFQTWLQNLKR